MVATKMSTMAANYTQSSDGRYAALTRLGYTNWRRHVMRYACEWCDLGRPPVCNGSRLCAEMARHVELQSRIKCRRVSKDFQKYVTSTPLETYIIQLATCAHASKLK